MNLSKQEIALALRKIGPLATTEDLANGDKKLMVKLNEVLHPGECPHSNRDVKCRICQ